MSNSVQQHQSNKQIAYLTEKAKQRIINHLDKNDKQLGVRLSLKKTGCSGLSYVFDYIDELNKEDVSVLIDDDYALYIDKKYFPYLKGVKIDYIKQGLNHKFVFDNPNQKGVCGCGESFSIE
jgi:iron-sulfur cluster assembly accessory protein